MALGTALTTGTIAAMAVFAKTLALRYAGPRGAKGAVAIAGIELLAGAFVLVFGLSLLIGVWTSAAPS
jgi:nickel/cobalt exporter